MTYERAEQLRAECLLLTDYELDELIAVTRARRDVAAAHTLPQTADLLNDALMVMVDVRTARQRLAEAVSDALCPTLPEVPD